MLIGTEHQPGMNDFNISCSWVETYLKSGYREYGSNLLHATAYSHATLYIICILNKYYKMVIGI